MLDEKSTVAVIGAGLVGASWAIVFARAGCSVRIYDSHEPTRKSVLDRILDSLQSMQKHKLISEPEAIASRIGVFPSLHRAVADADYIQESVFEDIATKANVSAAIDQAMSKAAIVGSSTSGFASSSFTNSLVNRARFLVVHPVNPPHLIPLVELVPASWTGSDVLEQSRRFMALVGQSPVVLNREIDGFILNRLQGALLDEAWRLFEGGYASAEDIDKTVSQGLGLRWSFMGPFETIDLNAPDGIADYARRLGPMYRRLTATRPQVEPWSDAAVREAEKELRRIRPASELAARRTWRDERLMAVIRRAASLSSQRSSS